MIDLETFIENNSQKFHPDRNYFKELNDFEELYDVCKIPKYMFDKLKNCCRMVDINLTIIFIHYPFWEYWFDEKKFSPQFGKLLKSFIFFRTLCLRK